jgi:hypothetical protein
MKLTLILVASCYFLLHIQVRTNALSLQQAQDSFNVTNGDLITAEVRFICYMIVLYRIDTSVSNLCDYLP